VNRLGSPELIEAEIMSPDQDDLARAKEGREPGDEDPKRAIPDDQHGVTALHATAFQRLQTHGDRFEQRSDSYRHM
jgi:hypothetical protein